MTQKGLYFYTNGFTGDVNDGAAPFSESEFRDYNRSVLTGNVADMGVLSGVDNDLEVTGVASPLSVDTGRAQVYGFHYFNDAVVNPTVTTPSIGDTGGRAVLRCNLTGANNPPAESEVRVLIILSADGNAAIPALVQTPGVTWDIPLATFVIDTAGDIWTDSSKSIAGVTDARVYAVSPLAGMVRLREFIGDGTTGTCTFQGIQQNLSHLWIVAMARSDDAAATAQLSVTLNEDIGLNYGASSLAIAALATVITQTAMGAVDSIRLGLLTGAGGEVNGDFFEVKIPHYRSSLRKTLSARINTVGDGTLGGSGVRSEITDGWWADAAAITRIDLQVAPGNFPTGTKITLYGMR